jgi:hypothetical protein
VKLQRRYWNRLLARAIPVIIGASRRPAKLRHRHKKGGR